MNAPLIDTHAHLDYLVRGTEDVPGEAAETVLARAREAGVVALVNPCVTPERFDEVLALAEAHPDVYAALAVHPTDVGDLDDTWLTAIRQRLSHPKVVALGETGLDYYHDLSIKDRQQACFRETMALAVETDKPVIIHDREAHEDVHRLVSGVPGVRGVMHCFSGDEAFGRQMIELGFFISFAGNVTFKNAKNLHEAARALPLEWLVIETDSPFLSPAPFRGQRNEPARVLRVAETLAELKDLSLEAVAEATTANACRLFGLPVPAFMR